MSELIFNSATKLAEMIRNKQVSPVEVVEAHVRRIEEVNPKLNAFVTTTFERARGEARSAELRITRGESVGPLHGVPVSIKDTFETAGVRTVAGSRLLEDHIPDRDAPVVARLKRAGAIILGKTNVPEFAMDFRSENLVFGRTSNPWDLGRVSGGSSGGEAAAIASGCSPAGVGSDLGGSIRVPSHFCGIVGLKPTPGRVPVTGHIPVCVGPFALGNSNGPLARRIEDLGLMLAVLAGFDAGDPQSAPVPVRDYRQIDPRKLRVMWYTNDGFAPVTQATRQTVERAAKALADRGLELAERRPAGIERAFELWYGFLGQAGVPGIVKMYEGREELMGPLMQALKAIVQPQTNEQFLDAWTGRDVLRASVVTEMMDYPIILAPVAAIPAFEHDHKGGFTVEGHEVEYLAAFSYTMTFNVLGLPGAVVPCGRSPEGLPIGVQIVGRPFEEETVLAVAAVLEEALGGYQRPPI
ncbi:MAG TPA: amidase [Blastocatellia bacterium]|nr:amidase [Blastocatellia bacterium]